VLLAYATLGRSTVIGDAADNHADDVEMFTGLVSKVEGRNH
jgi:hypothetical protein